ncbi:MULTISPECIES: DUF6602 domain-containing protein [unclassified Bradyrhizobium]|uniref:DUF6602 domain-containing protein n=1 Tax=unclassified Bradyrhizobium TaxID=2631580 RepID=UPI001FF7B1EF|nr:MULTISPECIES: DUF6602 domain-containing protein [unclassified Bradyrhizobium]MCK1615004.1 hypothetical protein [Bradyrhizobium sp. 163]MCK1761720.1 hypothetical protein [Bradyrhizobium sp. 136]
MSGWSLEKLMAGLHGEISLRLERSRTALGHPVAKGDATEGIWIELLQNYLPERYRANRAFVIDSTDTTSQQIDIVIYDRQYTPLIFNQDGTLVIPAESVYAVFEAKQSIDAAQVDYAAKKIASVRALHRTSLPIPSASGLQPAKTPGDILGGLLTFDSEWNPPMGDPLQKTLADADAIAPLDLGCVAAHGIFMKQDGHHVVEPDKRAATAFLLELIARLQTMATVPMIDVRAYAKFLKG